jgi:hypothetical protein
MLISLSLQLILQNTCLHFVVVLQKTTHGCVNNMFLGFQHFIKFGSYLRQKTIDFFASLLFNTLWTTAEIAVAVFLPEFLAPFCEDPQHLRIFYLNVSIIYLSLSKLRRIFGYFSSDQILSLLLNFGVVFFLFLIVYFNLFLTFSLSAMFLIRLIGPIFVPNILEKVGHFLLKILIICDFFFLLLLVWHLHEIVEHLHNQVIIVSTLSEFENYLAVFAVFAVC